MSLVVDRRRARGRSDDDPALVQHLPTDRPPSRRWGTTATHLASAAADDDDPHANGRKHRSIFGVRPRAASSVRDGNLPHGDDDIVDFDDDGRMSVRSKASKAASVAGDLVSGLISGVKKSFGKVASMASMRRSSTRPPVPSGPSASAHGDDHDDSDRFGGRRRMWTTDRHNIPTPPSYVTPPRIMMNASSSYLPQPEPHFQPSHGKLLDAPPIPGTPVSETWSFEEGKQDTIAVVARDLTETIDLKSANVTTEMYQNQAPSAKGDITSAPIAIPFPPVTPTKYVMDLEFEFPPAPNSTPVSTPEADSKKAIILSTPSPASVKNRKSISTPSSPRIPGPQVQINPLTLEIPSHHLSLPRLGSSSSSPSSPSMSTSTLSRALASASGSLTLPRVPSMSKTPTTPLEALITDVITETNNPSHLFWMPAHLQADLVLEGQSFEVVESIAAAKTLASAASASSLSSSSVSLPSSSSPSTLRRALSFKERNVLITPENIDTMMPSVEEKSPEVQSSPTLPVEADNDASVATDMTLGPSEDVTAPMRLERLSSTPLKRGHAKRVSMPRTRASTANEHYAAEAETDHLRRSVSEPGASALKQPASSPRSPPPSGSLAIKTALSTIVEDDDVPKAHNLEQLEFNSAEEVPPWQIEIQSRDQESDGASLSGTDGSSIYSDYSDSSNAETTETSSSPGVSALEPPPWMPSNPIHGSVFPEQNQQSPASTTVAPAVSVKAAKSTWSWITNILKPSKKQLIAEDSAISLTQPSPAITPAPFVEQTATVSAAVQPAEVENGVKSRSSTDDWLAYPPDRDTFMPPSTPMGPRYPPHIEKSIYRTSHQKLAQPRRPLAQQVMVSNLMLYILSVHADVTLNRNPGKKKGVKKGKGKKGQKKRRQPSAVDGMRNSHGYILPPGADMPWNVSGGVDQPRAAASPSPIANRRSSVGAVPVSGSALSIGNGTKSNGAFAKKAKVAGLVGGGPLPAQSAAATDEDEDDVPLGIIQIQKRASQISLK